MFTQYKNELLIYMAERHHSYKRHKMTKRWKNILIINTGIRVFYS